MGTSASKESAPGTSANYTKRALLVGCNYKGTSAELSGCVNDSLNWKSFLTDHFGFLKKDIIILLDEGDTTIKPTGKNIKENLKKLVEESKSGDVLFFQFSGHGVQVPADEGGDYEEDGLDEALCPCDLNLIIDDDLRDILSKLDPNVKFTMVSDCCHSGGMLDHKEIIIKGDAEDDRENYASSKKDTKDRDLIISKDKDSGMKNRSLEFSTMTKLLKESQGVDDGKHMRKTLLDLYGDDASNAAKAIKTRDAPVGDIHYKGPGKKPDESVQNDPNKGILITGCQSHETSADVTGTDGRSFGALSHTVTKLIKKYKKKDKNFTMSNKEVVLKVITLHYINYLNFNLKVYINIL